MDNAWGNRAEWEQNRQQDKDKQDSADGADSGDDGVGEGERVGDDGYGTAADSTDTSDGTATGGDEDSKAWQALKWARAIRERLFVETDLDGETNEKRLWVWDSERRVHSMRDAESRIVRELEAMFDDPRTRLPKPWPYKPGYGRDVLAVLKALEPRIDSRPGLVGFRNRTLDLSNPQSPEWWEPRPSDCLSFRLGYDWRKNAECPVYDRFLLEVVGDEEFGFSVRPVFSVCDCDPSAVVGRRRRREGVCYSEGCVVGGGGGEYG